MKIFKKIKTTQFNLIKSSNVMSTSTQQSAQSIDIFSCSKTLSNYFKLGKINNAQKLFDEIPEKNVVFWSIMIHGYARNGFHYKSLEFFRKMRVSGFPPNTFTVVGVLVGVIGLGDLRVAKNVHGLTVKHGIDFEEFVCSSMIDTYAKCGNLQDSYKLFQSVKNPGLVSYNVIIAGFQSNGFFEESTLLFNQFRKSSMAPNSVTMLNFVRVCIALGSQSLCESIHSLIIKFGFNSDISVNNSVLDMYSNLMDLNAATTLFDEMECKDIIGWTTMIGLLVNLEFASNALRFFIKMRESGVKHDAVVLMYIISACAILGDLSKGKQTHAQALVCGLACELPLVNSIIVMYSKSGDMKLSRVIFDQTVEKSLISWTVMIAGYVQNNQPRESLHLMTKLRKSESFFFDSILLANVLTACGELALLEVCQQLHCFAFKAGFINYISVSNSLISTYSKCGKVEHAHEIFKKIGGLRDVVSWNALINGFGINGHGEKSVALFHKMSKGGENPDSASYLCVLSACGHAGLVNEGLIIFNQMIEDVKIKPAQQHYGCIIDLLARAGCLSDARGLSDKIIECLDLNGWKALLNGCLIHGNTELAEIAAKRVSELDPEDSSQAVLLSNAYASVERFQDSQVLRLSLKKKKLVKHPGISLLNDMQSSIEVM